MRIHLMNWPAALAMLGKAHMENRNNAIHSGWNFDPLAMLPLVIHHISNEQKEYFYILQPHGNLSAGF